jgi:hypothetical protein
VDLRTDRRDQRGSQGLREEEDTVNDTTKLLIEFVPGFFIGVTLPSRYLVWSDDKPRSPRFNPEFRKLFIAGKFTLETER